MTSLSKIFQLFSKPNSLKLRSSTVKFTFRLLPVVLSPLHLVTCWIQSFHCDIRFVARVVLQTIASKSSSFSAATATSSVLRVGHYDNVDIDRLGEQALRETKEERDLNQRLKEIEAQLEGMSTTAPSGVSFVRIFLILYFLTLKYFF